MLQSMPLVTLVSQADFQDTTWALYGTPEAISSPNDLQHTRI